MSHAPFIWGSYLVALVVLGWCALAPVWRARRFRAAWQAREKALAAARNVPETSESKDHASRP